MQHHPHVVGWIEAHLNEVVARAERAQLLRCPLAKRVLHHAGIRVVVQPVVARLCVLVTTAYASGHGSLDAVQQRPKVVG